MFRSILLTLLLSFSLYSTSAVSETALETMKMVFQGSYTQEAIKLKLDESFKLFNVKISEENYKKAGRLLLKIRKKYEVPEMDIMNQMIFLHNAKGKLSKKEASMPPFKLFKKKAVKAAKSISIK